MDRRGQRFWFAAGLAVDGGRNLYRIRIPKGQRLGVL